MFVRQKTYIEHEVAHDLKPLHEPIWNVKCAGMPERSKQIFIANITGFDITNKEDKDEEQVKFIDSLSDEERKFFSKKLELEDFKIGLKVPGKLLPKRIPGGVLLCETTYEMREN